MATTRQTLKDYFKKYATPTEAQFAALIDSFVHKDEDSLTQSKIDGLTAALNGKVSTQDLGTAVATAVAETLQGGNLEVTPAAHEHAVSDISGLGARLTTLETSKADYEAFKTLVTAFLNDADVSDTTINRWKELEDFLAGITDSDTLAGMLQALKAEILAEVPQPQTGNYLKQIADLDAYTEAQEGEIVQYVGSTTENYRRGFCYERVVEIDDTTVGDPISWTSPLYRYTLGGKTYIKPYNADISTSSHMGYLLKKGSSDDYSDAGFCFYVADDYAINEGIKAYENDEKNYFPYGFFGSVLTPIEVQGTDVVVGSIVRPTEGRQRAQFIIRESDSRLFFLLECNRGGKNVILLTPAYEGEKCDPISNETEYYCFDDRNYAEVLNENYTANPICRVEVQNATSIATWQPIATSPVVS